MARAQSSTVSGNVLMQNPASRKVINGGVIPAQNTEERAKCEMNSEHVDLREEEMQKTHP